MASPKEHKGWDWEPVSISGSGRSYGRSGGPGRLLHQEVYDCGFCRGTGERPRGSRCPVCKGQEKVHVQPPAVICAFCRGRGEEKPRSMITCTACKGKGVVTVQEPIKICPACNGRGRQIGNSLYCMGCKGTGVVTVKTAQGGDGSGAIRHPSGSEREALQIIHELGRAGRHRVGGRMHVGPAYADYVCKSLLNKGLIERASADVFVLSEAGKKTFDNVKA